MSDSDDNGIQTLARNNNSNNDPENHPVAGKSSTESIRERPAKPRITVEYERVGSFDVFETICPLEFSGFPSPTPPPPPTPSPHRTARSKRRPRGKSTSNKKPLKTITIVDNLTSDSEDEITAAFNQKMLNLTEPPPVIMSIYLDTFFRSENPNVMEPESQATVFWAKGDSVKIPTCPPEDSESDLDPEIARYIEAQKEKKYNGENVTGESLWYDQDRSLIRNLHPNGSISLTSYGDTDEKIFGKTEVFDTILTPQERASKSFFSLYPNS